MCRQCNTGGEALDTVLTAAGQQTPRVVFLLYLNDATYNGEDGKRLASQLRQLLRPEARSRRNEMASLRRIHSQSRYHFMYHDTSMTPTWVALTQTRHRAAILAVHEQDDTRGACEFARFFSTTPDDLINVIISLIKRKDTIL